MKKRIRSILRVVTLVLVALIVGVNIYSISAARLAGNAVPMPFGIGASVVLSGSMEPELSVGDLLIIVQKEGYEVDDVVVYQNGRSAVVHRIVSMDKDTVITKGDANNTEDQPMPVERIKGEVLFAIPFVGFAIDLIKTPLGTLIVLGAAIFLLERSFHNEKKSDDAQMELIKKEIQKLKKEQDEKDG